jgi:hypothetical protein
MKRLRLATWSALAGLGLIAGCQSCPTNCCSTSCNEGGLLSRLGLRRSTSGSVIYDGPAGGYPGGAVVPPAAGGDCPCSTTGGGPNLDGPPPFMTIPGGNMTIPGGSFPGMNMLPPPMPGAAPPLAPVPNGSAPATPAPPSPVSRAG